jgi:hypothetical protein
VSISPITGIENTFFFHFQWDFYDVEIRCYWISRFYTLATHIPLQLWLLLSTFTAALCRFDWEDVVADLKNAK